MAAKDKRVTALIASIEKRFGSLHGTEVKWPDGRVFRCTDGKWAVVKE